MSITHTKTLTNGDKIDIFKLIQLLKNRPVVTKSIDELPIPNKSKKTGFSQKRLKVADISFPIIIDKDNNIIDGRHRLAKLVKQGEEKIKVIIATDFDLKSCAIVSGSKLTDYSEI